MLSCLVNFLFFLIYFSLLTVLFFAFLVSLINLVESTVAFSRQFPSRKGFFLLLLINIYLFTSKQKKPRKRKTNISFTNSSTSIPKLIRNTHKLQRRQTIQLKSIFTFLETKHSWKSQFRTRAKNKTQ
jgi:hypothetical protein